MSELWTTAELKHYHRTGKEPGGQSAGEKKPKATRRTQSKLPAEVPLSVEAAWSIYKVKAGLVSAAIAAEDVAFAVYEKLAAEKEKVTP